MEKFMLIVRADLEKLRKLKEADRFADWPDMLEWVKSIADAGKHLAGAPLLLEGRQVAKKGVVTDGPFIESKEGILGYDLILAENMEEAVAIAQQCPMVKAGVAVREVRAVGKSAALDQIHGAD